MGELCGLLLNRGNHTRMAVPDVEHGNARQEVEILVAQIVPEAHTLAAHELDRVAHVGGDHGLALERLQFGQAHADSPLSPDTRR